MHLPLITGRISIDDTLQNAKGDVVGSSNLSPLQIETFLMYFDLFSLEEDLPSDREHFSVVFLGAIVEYSM